MPHLLPLPLLRKSSVLNEQFPAVVCKPEVHSASSAGSKSLWFQPVTTIWIPVCMQDDFPLQQQGTSNRKYRSLCNA